MIVPRKKIEVGNLKMKIVRKITHTHTLSLSLYVSMFPKKKKKRLPSSPWWPLPKDHGQHRIK
jgi:hypothetical protein